LLARTGQPARRSGRHPCGARRGNSRVGPHSATHEPIPQDSFKEVARDVLEYAQKAEESYTAFQEAAVALAGTTVGEHPQPASRQGALAPVCSMGLESAILCPCLPSRP